MGVWGVLGSRVVGWREGWVEEGRGGERDIIDDIMGRQAAAGCMME